MSLTTKQQETVERVSRQAIGILRKAGVPAVSVDVYTEDNEGELEAARLERAADSVGERDIKNAYLAKARAIREGTE